MTEAVALFLVVTLAAYTLFGGADFGAGILEATLPSRDLRRRLEGTLAPIWEANHVWLIAVIVILFVGFPRFYAHGFTRLFVPISCALLAILLRGVFFTLRKYDPSPGPLITQFYSALFRLSSAIAPLFFGMIVGGLLTEHPGNPESIPRNLDYAAIYLTPWLNPFGLLCGLFVTALFGYLAGVYFYGEVHSSHERGIIWKRIRIFLVAAVVLGGAVLALGAVTHRVPLSNAFHPVQLGCQAVATVGIFSLWTSRRRGAPWGMRFSAGAQVLAILVGWFHAQSPVLLRTDTVPLTLHAAAAPPITQFWLLIGLGIVTSLVVPLLVWLYRVFGASTESS